MIALLLIVELSMGRWTL